MGEVLNNGVYLPDRGERNAYDGLKGNWNTLDSIAGKVPGYDGHISDTDIHVTAADKQTWNGKADASHVHNANDVTTGVFDAARIPNLDASKITTGTIDIERLPQGALERLVKVADQAARYALTASDVQLGDTVQQLDTGVMYVVTDETKLDSADGYTEYTAGSATSVPWSGVTGKPADYTPASHSHGNITNDGKVGTAANKPLITGTDGVIQAGSFGTLANTFCEGNDSRLSDARTPVAHTHTKSDVADLFNSANTWSGLNTYSNGQIRIKSQSQEIGVIPSSNVIQYLEFADKNNEQHGVIGLWDYSDGASEIQMYAADKFKNGQKDPTGTAESTFLSFGFKANGSKFLTFSGQLQNSLIPNASNSYDLGSSAYQWNNLYAKNYYYNGVAWGLDKANVWTGWNQFNNLSLYSNDVTYNQAPSSNTELPSIRIMGGGRYCGAFDYVWRSTGENVIRLSLGSYTSAGVFGYWACNFGVPRDFSDGGKFGTPAFYPNTDGYNLGDSTHKWKTLNGVNPGALSLPDYDETKAIIVDTTGWTYDGSTANQLKINNATQTINGWLFIRIENVASTDRVIIRFNGNLASDPAMGFSPVSTGINLIIPIPANKITNIYLTKSPLYIKFYPCLGNV